MQNVLPVVEGFARDAALAFGVELVSVQLRRVKVDRGETQQIIISICINRESGTAIKDCEDVSRFVERHLDEKNIISGRYSLEVSSRGI